MDYVFLALSVVFVAMDGLAGSFFNRKNKGLKDSAPIYNCVYGVVATVSWGVLFLLNPEFDVRVLPYSILFGIFYASCQIGYINALRTGPLSLSALILQTSLIGTTIWGFFFWDTEFSLLVGIGLVLVAIALWLCLYTGKSKDGKTEKLSFKWLLFSLMAFVGNAGCSITQRTQHMKFDGKYGNQLMVFAVAISTIVTFVIYLRSDKRDTKVILKRSSLFPAIAGLCNVSLNFLIILLAGSSLSPSIIYPVIAVGGLSASSICSVIVFHEKLRASQWIGIVIGAVAVAILSI